MKTTSWLAVALLPCAALAQHRDDRNWRVQDQETINRSFDVSGGSGAQKLLVDNISGYIHVTGYSGKEVQVKVQKHIGADSNEGLAEAKRDVKLDMSQQGNFVRLFVDGPFRGNNGVNYRGDEYYGYRVIFDYDIQVPFATELVLKTINAGEIEVRKTTGDFDINGLNGGIDMEEVSGSGSVRTLNGPLKVTFTKNPSKNSEFRTLNGKIDVYFQPALNADLNFHTLNGGIYSDFDVTTRPTKPASGENVNGKFIYRSDRRAMEGRAGSGGPELTFNALNGEIRLHSKTF
ncbi:MAG TPA: hypothetical protein VKU19_40410 [Bryobacteraceae bacterium]|nr:hypothetical protein [Bryobacteraceae bacterium]